MSRAESKRAGERAEAEVIERVPELAAVTERDAHVDAVVTEVLIPSMDLPTVCLLVVEKGTVIEIKSCAVVVTASQQRGRFYLRREQHERLLDAGGSYLFAVTPPHGSRPLAMKIVPATVMTDAVPSWIEPEEREPYAQVVWSRVFDPDELEGRR